MKQSRRVSIAIVLYLLLSFSVLLPSQSALAAEKVSSFLNANTAQEWLEKNCSQVFDNKLLLNTFIYLHYTPENGLQLGTTDTRSGYVDYTSGTLETESFTPIPADSPLGACLLIDDTKIDFSYEALDTATYAGYQFSSIVGAASGKADLANPSQAKLTVESIVDLTGASQIDKFHIGKDAFFPSSSTDSTVVDELYAGAESPLAIKASKANIYILTLNAEVTRKDGTIVKTSAKYTFACLTSVPSGLDPDNGTGLDEEESNVITPTVPIEPNNPSQSDPLHPDNKPIIPHQDPDKKPSLDGDQGTQQDGNQTLSPSQPPKNDAPKPVTPPATNKPKPSPLAPSGNGNASRPNTNSTSPDKPVTSLSTSILDTILSHVSPSTLRVSSAQSPTLRLLPEPQSAAPAQPKASAADSSTPKSARGKSTPAPASKVVSNETSPSNQITEWESQSAKVLLAAGSVVAVGGGCIYLRLIRKP